MRKLSKQIGVLCLLLNLWSCAGGSSIRTLNEAKSNYEADIIVYGGTSAAITSAVQAARMGKSALVVSPDTHLGGLSSGGLGFSDTGNKQVIGGLAREFYHRIYLHYQKDDSWQLKA